MFRWFGRGLRRERERIYWRMEMDSGRRFMDVVEEDTDMIGVTEEERVNRVEEEDEERKKKEEKQPGEEEVEGEDEKQSGRRRGKKLRGVRSSRTL